MHSQSSSFRVVALAATAASDSRTHELTSRARIPCWTAAALAIVSTGGLARAQTTERESVASGGIQGNSTSFGVSVSADGRYVAFEGESTNLVAGDTNDRADVFVRDRQNGTTARVSVATGGAEGNGNSGDPWISADGRFVTFRSLATNLVAGDTNAAADVFVHDRLSGTTERVSISTAGVQCDANCYRPSISADGRIVAFQSRATNLVAGDVIGMDDVFVRDRQTGTTIRASVGLAGAEPDNPCEYPSVSADGRFVTFHSGALNLHPAATNGFNQVFVRDLLNGTNDLVSVSSGGAQGNGGGVYPSISGDGRFVAYHSGSSNLVANDTNFSDDVFVRDRLAGTTERVSISTSGAQATSSSYDAAISGDGRIVAFECTAANLVAGDTAGALDVLVRDRQLATTTRVSVSTGGAEGDGGSWYPAVSLDGRFVGYESYATNLVAGDTNAQIDAFLHDRGAPAPIAFCSGDGSGTACPCGAGAAGNGCPSSVNASGAHLAASGGSTLAADTLVLAGSGMPNSSALYFQGTTQVAGGAGAVFGDGLRCAGGAIVRLGTKTNAGGASQYPTVGDPAISVRGLVTTPGVRTYQVWYRNAAAFCAPETFNLTNGMSVTWSAF